MEETTNVKLSDLTNLIKEFSHLRTEIKQLRESEEQLKAFSIQQTAKMLNLHYNSVRKLIIRHKLFAKYLDGDTGKCIVPLWAIKEYLEIKEQSTELQIPNS
jgi:hypothetical protein